MSRIRTLQLSFGSGEISPEMFGRMDDARYRAGLAVCRNFIVKPQGVAANRPGTTYVNTVKNPSVKARLIPFTYSTTQTMVIELGAGYCRFHTQGATLLSGGVPYEIANPYAAADLFAITYVQSADVLTLCHPNYPPMELRRLGATSWTLTAISFASTLAAPTAPTVTPTGAGTQIYTYVVTAVDSTLTQESAASPATSANNNLFTSGNRNTVAWTAVTGASYYNVYKLSGGLYGYIGQTSTLSIVDDNIAADMSKTPPIYDAPFGSAGNYPGAVSYFQQRRCFAGTSNAPQNIWMTKSGTESAMSYSLPVRDDDRIAFRVAARDANTIRHIVPLTQLLLLTSSAEWHITSINSDAVTPTSVSVAPQSYVGASPAQPVLVNNSLIYVAARGGHPRELAYNWQANGFITGDLALRAAHLFDTYDIVDLAYSKAPIPIVWMVSTSGTLLGLTYIPEQQIGAWHHHDTTNGTFESCCVVAEGTEDVLYVIVNRTINGVQTRYVERLASRQFGGVAQNAYFVDCGATYNGAPASTVAGLTWLEGQTVSVLADGAVQNQKVVTGGAITLDYPASVVQVGLPITADLETLPLSLQTDAAIGQGLYKNVNKLWMRVFQSSGVWAGPDAANLRQYKQRSTEPPGSPPALVTAQIDLMITPAWGSDGQVFVRQSDPLPLTVASVTAEVSLAG